MEYIGLTHESARNIYMMVGGSALAIIIPLVTMILRPNKDRVVKQKERFRDEMKVSTKDYTSLSELYTLFDRLYVQERKIEKIDWDSNLALWCCVITIFLAVLGIFTNLLRWQIDTVVFIFFALFTVGFVISIIPSLNYYLNDNKK